MATYGDCRAISIEAGVDLSSFQYHFCVVKSDGQADSGGTALSAQGIVNGIVGDPVATVGTPFTMVVPDGGRSKIKLGATLAAGAEVATAADGRAIAFVAGAGARAWGILLEGGDANEIMALQFYPSGSGA